MGVGLLNNVTKKEEEITFYNIPYFKQQRKKSKEAYIITNIMNKFNVLTSNFHL